MDQARTLSPAPAERTDGLESEQRVNLDDSKHRAANDAWTATMVRRLRLLDYLADAVLVVDGDGRVRDVPTSRGATLLDVNPASLPTERVWVWDVLFPEQPTRAAQLQVNFEQLVEGFLPIELCLEQLPHRVERHGRLLELTFYPVASRGVLLEVVLVLQDVTERGDDHRRNAENAEFRRVTESLLENMEAARAFFGETDWLLENVQKTDGPDRFSHLHTVKGNLGVFGFEQLATVAHMAEEALVAEDLDAFERNLATLERGWASKRSTFGKVFNSSAESDVMLPRDEYEDFVMQLMCQTDHAELLGSAQRWSMMPVGRIFARMALQMERVAGTLGKQVRTVSQPNGVRLPNAGLEALWASMVHLVRNAADHGLESADERQAAGKDPVGTFTLAAEHTDDELILRIGDDGRGIDWSRVRERAAALGLPHDTHEQLVDALFFSGLTTQSEANATSGRGAGTSAVKAAVEPLDGQIRVTSSLGAGTTFEISIPLASLATLGLLS